MGTNVNCDKCGKRIDLNNSLYVCPKCGSRYCGNIGCGGQGSHCKNWPCQEKLVKVR